MKSEEKCPCHEIDSQETIDVESTDLIKVSAEANELSIHVTLDIEEEGLRKQIKGLLKDAKFENVKENGERITAKKNLAKKTIGIRELVDIAHNVKKVAYALQCVTFLERIYNDTKDDFEKSFQTLCEV